MPGPYIIDASGDAAKMVISADGYPGYGVGPYLYGGKLFLVYIGYSDHKIEVWYSTTTGAAWTCVSGAALVMVGGGPQWGLGACVSGSTLYVVATTGSDLHSTPYLQVHQFNMSTLAFGATIDALYDNGFGEMVSIGTSAGMSAYSADHSTVYDAPPEGLAGNFSKGYLPLLLGGVLYVLLQKDWSDAGDTDFYPSGTPYGSSIYYLAYSGGSWQVLTPAATPPDNYIAPFGHGRVGAYTNLFVGHVTGTYTHVFYMVAQYLYQHTFGGSMQIVASPHITAGQGACSRAHVGAPSYDSVGGVAIPYTISGGSSIGIALGTDVVNPSWTLETVDSTIGVFSPGWSTYITTQYQMRGRSSAAFYFDGCWNVIWWSSGGLALWWSKRLGVGSWSTPAKLFEDTTALAGQWQCECDLDVCVIDSTHVGIAYFNSAAFDPRFFIMEAAGGGVIIGLAGIPTGEVFGLSSGVRGGDEGDVCGVAGRRLPVGGSTGGTACSGTHGFSAF